jgi:hypothetical protein
MPVQQSMQLCRISHAPIVGGGAGLASHGEINRRLDTPL